jgi:hypothetical protein
LADLYIGSCLSGASEQLLVDVNLFKEYLRGRGHKIFEFVTDPKATPEDVYRNDILSAVRHCQGMIAFLDERSTGLGLELGAALYRFNKPILGICRWEVHLKVSRLIRGISAEFSEECFAFRPYKHIQWVEDIFLPEFLKNVEVPREQLNLSLPSHI